MADKQTVLSEIGDSIVVLMNHFQSDNTNLSGIENSHNPLAIQFVSSLALAYAQIDHGLHGLSGTAGSGSGDGGFN